MYILVLFPSRKFRLIFCVTALGDSLQSWGQKASVRADVVVKTDVKKWLFAAACYFLQIEVAVTHHFSSRKKDKSALH